MSPILDDVLVVAALLASAVFALFKLGPRALRRGVLSRVAAWAGRAPAWTGLRGVAAHLAMAAAKSAGSCGGCDTCGGEGGAEAGGTAAPRNGSEIKIPLASIGRRR